MAGNSSGFSTKDISESLRAHLAKDTSDLNGKLSYVFILHKEKRQLTETIRAQQKLKEELEAVLRGLKVLKDERKEAKRVAYLQEDLKERETTLCATKKKLERQKRLNEELDERIGALQEKLDAMQERGEHIREQIKRLEPHCAFLEKIAQKSGRFRDADELMSYYYSMKSTAEVLDLASQRGVENIANKTAKVARYQKECRETLLRTYTAMSRDQRELDTVRGQKINLESQWAHIQSTASERKLELVTLRWGVYSLYRVLHDNLGVEFDDAPVDPEDTSAQLAKITEYIHILTSIVEDLKK